MTTAHVDTASHPIDDPDYADDCRRRLDAHGSLVLGGFFTGAAVERVVAESAHREREAFYAHTTHNVYLTPSDPDLDVGHAFNRQITSSKGLIADDQIPVDSPLREVYQDETFRQFLCRVLGISDIHGYADHLSSINVHFASAGRELGWHFDNSSFAVTMLLQAPEAGGVFQYVPDVRNAEGADRTDHADRELEYEQVAAVLDGRQDPRTLEFSPGDLVLFRGRNALHRVTPTLGPTTRMLVVFAFNDAPGVRLSDSALMTFYGRTN